MRTGTTILSATALLLAASGSLRAEAPSGVVAATSAPRGLAIGEDIGVGQHLVTGPEGPTQLLFNDGSTLTLGPRSDVTIERFSYDPDTRTGRLALRQAAGVMRLVGGRATKDAPAVIDTPGAHLELRGGIGYVGVDAATGATEASLAYGRSLTATSTSTGETRTLTQQGFTLTIETGQPIASGRIDLARLDTMFERLAGSPGNDGGATTLPDPNGPGVRAIAGLAIDQMPAPTVPGTTPSDRLAAVTALTNPLVAQTAQTITTGAVASNSLVRSGNQIFAVTTAPNGTQTLTSVGSFTATFALSASLSVSTISFSANVGKLPPGVLLVSPGNATTGTTFLVNGSFFTNNIPVNFLIAEGLKIVDLGNGTFSITGPTAFKH